MQIQTFWHQFHYNLYSGSKVMGIYAVKKRPEFGKNGQIMPKFEKRLNCM